MRLLPAALALALLACPPVFAEEPSTPAGPAKDALAPVSPASADPGASEAQVSKMRERWRKMPNQQREEMRQKADRRLIERYELLSPQEQVQIRAIHDEIAKLNKEQRSIFRAQFNQKIYKERQQKKAMKDQESKPLATPAAETAPQTAPAGPPAPSLAAVPVSPKPAEKKK